MSTHQHEIRDTTLRLRALEAGEAPHSPALIRDERGVVVGPQGLVMLPSVRHRAAFLAALSHVADLATGLQLEQARLHTEHDRHTLLVLLTPPETTDPPSLFYDTVQGALSAARLSVSRVRLAIGDGRVFVPYASPDAPHGYDVQGAPPDHGRVQVLPQGALHLPEPEPQSLVDALLEVPLQPAPHAPTPTTLTVLTERRLAALIADYMQRHGLAYAVRFLVWQQDDQAVQVALFDSVYASDVRPIPAFACDFLRRLPRTTLLTDALEAADLEQEPLRRVLVAWGQRTLLYLPHIQHALPPRSLLILSDHRQWRPALVDRLPPRQPMVDLTRVSIAAPGSVTMSSHAPGQLRLRLSVWSDGSSHGPVHGLLLDARSLQRLRRMVRFLPGPFFAHLQIAIGDGVALLVTTDPQGSIEGLPFGQPLIRSEPTNLLLPYGTRLRPTLPPDILVPVLDMDAEQLTVLTRTQRYDVPVEAFRPPGSLLVLDTPMQRHTIAVHPTPLPPLDLSDLEEAAPESATPATPPAPQPTPEPRPAAPTRPDPAPASRLRTVIHTLGLGQRPAMPEMHTPAFEEQLRQRARSLEQAGEYEIAAAFYAYLNDDRRAAHCYRQLVRQEQSSS